MYNCELGASAVTGKRVKGDNNSAIKENYFPIIDLVLIIFLYYPATTMTFKIILMERLLINRDLPHLNKNWHSLLLKLFDG